MCQWMRTHLASASTDGTVKIWEDRKAVPLAILSPHDGNVVNCIAFLTAAHLPDHVVLLTGGPLNQEVKLWASASDECWLLHFNSNEYAERNAEADEHDDLCTSFQRRQKTGGILGPEH